ncbi:glycerate kinase [Leucobacter sp. CSA1]|uniref:Glycerate kinase n=1 Tax=Leucobacter chromiisoli TaxID=2796471 RepID=A0A934Q6X2_9MICO|nr:glycerate kinase [Leucobacter chromiisoli]MBK0418808.1 glycerate kinase [Leucobacter chromiisoli]
MAGRAPLIVIAPDSFKGSCSSPEAGSALALGVRDALGDGMRIRELPMADGGEGTLDALAAAWGGRVLDVETVDALGRPCTARFGLSADGRTAVVEAAEANGLPRVSDVPAQPLRADTYGVGLIALEALRRGAEEILLCVGGSATSDGGSGFLRALGARLLDESGVEIDPGAAGLPALRSVDLSALGPAARAARWRIAVDVDNPLVGPRGAGAVFGPQKGAAPGDIAVIDAGLARLADALASRGGASAASLTARPGLGAAGGLPLAAVAALGAETVPGAELVAGSIGLDEALAEASLVIAGEGRLDAQSLGGKVVSRILEGAKADRTGSGRTPPVVVIAGSVELSAAECRAAGIAAALSIARGPATLAELTDDCAELLSEAAAQACGLLAAAASGVRSR